MTQTKFSMKVADVTVQIETIGDTATVSFIDQAGTERTIKLVQWKEMQQKLQEISGQTGFKLLLLVQEFLRRIVAGTDTVQMHISPETLDLVLRVHFPEIFTPAEQAAAGGKK
ncbi:MAG: hypothetical protein JWO13_796 [Acidobacteriales bacterium]|nr:hypothetical protein [Terriglobales bacterium]